MKFGVFDHLDRNDLPLQAFYAERGLLREVSAQALEDLVTDRTVAAIADIAP